MELNSFFKKINYKDGIWICSQINNIESKFSDEVQDRLFKLEDRSWWFKYRANVINNIAKNYFKQEIITFDIGGGNGYTTKYMQERRYQMALLEPTLEACINAQKRGLQTIICGSLDKDLVIDNSIKQIFLLDVLEHIEDDVGFLRLMNQKIAFGGWILLTVPAFPILWSSEDDAAGHYRRYTLEQLHNIVSSAGFSVIYCNYFFNFLFFPILLVRVGMEKLGLMKLVKDRTLEEKERIKEQQFGERGWFIENILKILERCELHKLLKNRKIGFGSSLICVISKKEEGI